MKSLAKSTVLIVGLGQIGGSIAMALRDNQIVSNVIGFDPDRRTVRLALKSRVVDHAAVSLHASLDGADIIVLASPVREIVRELPSVLNRLRPDQFCIDVAGTKDRILRIANAHTKASFVGGHPIAGSEQPGFAGAVSGLFANKTFVLIPARHTSASVLARARQFVKGLGARPLIMTAALHDKLLARTSHLPYALAVSLTNVAARGPESFEQLLPLIGGSFQSATRVARSSVRLTVDMLLTNPVETRRAIDSCVDELRIVKRLLRTGDERALTAYVSRAAVIASHAADNRHRPRKSK